MINNKLLHYCNNIGVIRRINLGNKKEAVRTLKAFKTNDYVPFDIELINSHLKNINDSLGINIFRKRSLFITSKTLWECMQPLGARGKHNFHGLSPEEVYDSLRDLQSAKCVVNVYESRFVIVTSIIAACGDPIIAVVETGSSLTLNRNANINKVVTLYPKKKLDNCLNRNSKYKIIIKK